MTRNDTISGILALIGYGVIASGVLMGLYLASVGGGILFLLIYTLSGFAFGMLFLGLSIILTKLDDLGEAMSHTIAEPLQEVQTKTQDAE